MGTESLRLPAHAKLNLSLEVLGKRDDGYHDIATILQTVDLADQLTVSSSRVLEVYCDNPELSGPRNIVWDAAVKLAAHGGVEPWAKIKIHKRIPMAAGLGGGSADAATGLLGLNRFWGLGFTEDKLLSIASELGSDVPFLVKGGTAIGTGRGDLLEHLTSQTNLRVLLIAPAQSIANKTPTLYGALTPNDYSDGTHTRRLAGSTEMSTGKISSDLCLNAFTRAALEIFPGLADVWEKTAAIVKHRPCLSGAGPAFFCLPSDDAEREEVADALQGTGAKVYLVRTINPAQPV